MLGDLTSHRLIIVKGGLFLLTGSLAAGMLLFENWSLRTVALLVIAVWSLCRAYYFAFYVVQHYVDDRFRFAGLGAFAAYLWRRWRGKGP